MCVCVFFVIHFSAEECVGRKEHEVRMEIES